jgi:hypothetical protein
MHDLYVTFGRWQGYVLTPHCLFRLANPDAIMPGRMHVVRYHPYDQFADIVAVGLYAGGGTKPPDYRGVGPPAPA